MDRYNDDFCIGECSDANMSNYTTYTPITLENTIPVWKKDLFFMVSSLAAFIVYQFPASVSPIKNPMCLWTIAVFKMCQVELQSVDKAGYSGPYKLWKIVSSIALKIPVDTCL